MLTLVLPPEITEKMTDSLRRAGRREIGGILMAEHIGVNEFYVIDMTVHRRGTFASFVRRIEESLGRLMAFFERSDRDYRRFNYIGEWHSHPCFAPEPSQTDDASMREIIEDSRVGANFVVLVIVKLDHAERLVATAHTYLPHGDKYRAILKTTT